MQEGKSGGSSPEGRNKEELGPALRAFGVGGVMEPDFSWNKEVKRISKKSFQHQDNFLVRSSSGHSRKVRREIAEGRNRRWETA